MTDRHCNHCLDTQDHDANSIKPVTQYQNKTKPTSTSTSYANKCLGLGLQPPKPHPAPAVLTETHTIGRVASSPRQLAQHKRWNDSPTLAMSSTRDSTVISGINGNAASSLSCSSDDVPSFDLDPVPVPKPIAIPGFRGAVTQERRRTADVNAVIMPDPPLTGRIRSHGVGMAGYFPFTDVTDSEDDDDDEDDSFISSDVSQMLDPFSVWDESANGTKEQKKHKKHQKKNKKNKSKKSGLSPQKRLHSSSSFASSSPNIGKMRFHVPARQSPLMSPLSPSSPRPRNQRQQQSLSSSPPPVAQSSTPSLLHSAAVPAKNHSQPIPPLYQLHAYQRALIATAMHASLVATTTSSSKPRSPRLMPLGSPAGQGPMTPLDLSLSTTHTQAQAQNQQPGSRPESPNQGSPGSRRTIPETQGDYFLIGTNRQSGAADREFVERLIRRERERFLAKTNSAGSPHDAVNPANGL